MPKLCSFGCAPSGFPMHRFPNAYKFPERFKAWVTLVGGKLQSASDYEHYQKKLICDIHFTPKDKVRNNRLNAYAIPSLHLHGSSASIMFEQEPSFIATSTLSHTSTSPANTGTVHGIVPAVILEHIYSADSRSTRKTFGKGFYEVIDIELCPNETFFDENQTPAVGDKPFKEEIALFKENNGRT